MELSRLQKASRIAAFAIAGALAASAPCIAASDEQAFAISVPKLDVPPNLNGVIDASWSKAATATVAFDFTYQRQGEPTTVYIAQDSVAVDVAFDVTQREPLTANQETNGMGAMSDDYVAVVFWPQGTQGFQYFFGANAKGARFQSSSENASYSPEWTATTRRSYKGYVVTMRIPLNIIRSGHASNWKAQFERVTVATNSTTVWAHAPNQRFAMDATFSGTLKDVAATQEAAALRPKPRVQFYGLGELTTAANGGNTSRVGADVALPVTATSSLIGTFHPDYSNLEIDQQTIAPTAYQRQYADVRPFFTQATSSYNSTFSCTNCPTTLYTPSIPSFGAGYAYEGTQGPLTFGAFDAAGTQRSDSGQALDYTVSNSRDIYAINSQRIAVNTPFVHDVTTSANLGYLNQHTHLFEYFNYGQDRGNFVSDPGQGDYFEYGGGFVDQLVTVGVTFQKIGAQFSPADGFVAQNDIAGYTLFYNRTYNFSPNAALHDLRMNTFYGRFHDHTGNLAQADGSGGIQLDFRNLVSLHLFTGAQGVETTYSRELLPYNTNGFTLGYKTATTTPTSVTYSGGLYQHGRLTSWSYLTTQPLMRRLNLSLEADESLYVPTTAVEPTAQQWLERTGLDWQFSRDASLVVGARRIIGRNLPNSFQPSDVSPATPCGTLNGFSPFDCVNAGNVSFALHFLRSHNEFYVVYGNPNSLATTPALFLKWISYFGAEKGT